MAQEINGEIIIPGLKVESSGDDVKDRLPKDYSTTAHKIGVDSNSGLPIWRKMVLIGNKGTSGTFPQSTSTAHGLPTGSGQDPTAVIFRMEGIAAAQSQPAAVNLMGSDYFDTEVNNVNVVVTQKKALPVTMYAYVILEWIEIP